MKTDIKTSDNNWTKVMEMNEWINFKKKEKKKKPWRKKKTNERDRERERERDDTYFEVTVAVDQKILGLEISVNQVEIVQIFKG